MTEMPLRDGRFEFAVSCRTARALALVAGALVLSSAALSGCLVGPDYATPPARTPETWSGGAASTANAEWWKEFGDPALDALVERALAQNLTLQQAGLRVIQARARRGISVGEFFPQVQAATGDASVNQVSKNVPRGVGDRSYQDYAVGLDAVWELDFWGRFRRGIESADAFLEASVADYDDVLVMLVGDVASDYVRIRSLQDQLVVTRANVKAQQDTLDLTRVRARAGATSDLDVSTAEATLANTQSLVPVLEDELRQTTLALCVLLGRTPSDLDDLLGPPQAVPTVPESIAVGIPADLLRRRPDVRRAERTAAALSAEIGVAAADLYPAISISGTTAFHTTTATNAGHTAHRSDLFDSDSFEGFAGLHVNWPLLNYGRIRNGIRVADAQYEEAVAAYRNVVLQAASEVEAGLSSVLRSREQAAFLAESVTAAERAVELSLIQYRQGAVDFLRVNQAQVDLAQRQIVLVSARANVAQAAITTYRALGGGWEVRAGKEFVPPETIDAMRARTDWGDLLSTPYEGSSDFFLFPRPSANPPVSAGKDDHEK
jgi:NodT family efflux transporter outer membrane factor (OMF) lipoprotein